MTAPYWVGKQFWQALWSDLRGEAKKRNGELDVLVACFGGHGRTGTVLTALAIAAGAVPKNTDPIAWMRSNYCDYAIESITQLSYLTKTFDFITTETVWKAPVTTAVTKRRKSRSPRQEAISGHPGPERLDMYSYLVDGY